MDSEDYDPGMSFEKIRFQLDPNKINDIKDLTKIFVNYKRDTETGKIVLYFNYFNYLNTPFVKIKDNKVYPEIIPSTFCEIMPGENKPLDIMIQFKYTNGGVLYGVKNAVLASYQIFNVSDDKPKFVIQKCGIIRKDSLIETPVPYASIKASQLSIDVSETFDDEIILDEYISITNNYGLSSGYTIYMQYDPYKLSIYENEGYNSSKYSIDNSISGIVSITVNTGIDVNIPLKVRISKQTLRQNIGSEMFMIITNDDMMTNDGISVIPEITHGKLSIYRSKQQILVLTNKEYDDDNLSGYFTNGHFINPI